ncbi:uncharacterized protein BX663DRAFT_498432 [Cokeromyces recurvatus]|uniref:uncharacterized protein n=1 Tax=Cokeromyces recurvatus TaxID=90255 RepID=UPI00221F4C03|nr:uncharacterized protein BX663DRAFT_498432 [Cokeromyces recurvatus]KAI7905995.1 hypothetical protein BX663DRAFT_498432 [Cokeromyces recurvatus]
MFRIRSLSPTLLLPLLLLILVLSSSNLKEGTSKMFVDYFQCSTIGRLVMLPRTHVFIIIITIIIREKER